MYPMERLLALAAVAGLAGIEQGMSYGTPSLKHKGRFLARLKDETTLVIRCPLDEKEMLMAAEPAIYFETDHYVGYPALLVRLDAIDDARLKARLERAWLMQAEKQKPRTASGKRKSVPNRP
jgi:hypothetical protein